MSQHPKFLAVIPARGGSKGIPRKNIKMIAGKPLIYYSIAEAKKSKYLDRIVVSTEDAEIKAVALEYGAEVVDRPVELAGDKSTTPDALLDALKQLKERDGYEPDAVVLLQVTTPLRKAADIDGAIELFMKSGATSTVSVCEAPDKMNPHWVRRIDENGLLKTYLPSDEHRPHMMRQELPKVYWRNGMIYITRTDVLKSTRLLYGDRCVPYIMEPRYRVNLDEELDFMMLELLVNKGLVQLGP